MAERPALHVDFVVSHSGQYTQGMTITASVNGESISVDTDPAEPLILVLRNALELPGTRYGCGLEQCGACRVMVNGELKYACTTTVSEVDGAEIRTVDGIKDDGALHPLQEAFLELNAGQCGYCLSGILVTATRILETNASPSETEIREALDDHLCRCGAHNRIVRAIQLAANNMNKAQG